MRYIIICMQIILCTAFAKGQSAREIKIEECYSLARQNYPLIKQLELVDKVIAYSVENAAKGFLPQVSINGQATYQSDVTEVPLKIPGISLPGVDKDQYKLYADISQAVYDGGITKLQKQSLQANGNAEKQKIEIELYNLKERINQLFFSVLIIDERLKQNELLKKDIQSGLTRTEAAIANGTALRSSANVLKAELLKIEQHIIEMQSTRNGYIDMLSLFINRTLEENTVFIKPVYQPVSREINRPELKLYEYQYKTLDIQNSMIRAKNLPKLSLFLQGGVGKPALNMLSNKLDPYYIGGIKMSWPITGSYTVKNEKALINNNRRNIDLLKETFLLNTRVVIKQQDAEIAKFEKLLLTDNSIIELRMSIKNASFAQLENGVITTSDYLREVNAEDQARQDKILHDIQLLMVQYNNKTTTGN